MLPLPALGFSRDEKIYAAGEPRYAALDVGTMRGVARAATVRSAGETRARARARLRHAICKHARGKGRRATRTDVSENPASCDHAPFSVDTVIRHHHVSVVRFLRRRGASYEDACDLAQEAYVRLLKYEGASDIASPPAMLFRIAGNVVADRLRAAARRAGRHVELDDDELESHEPSAERELSAEQQVTAIDRAIAELSPRCRSLFLLSRVEGLTYEQIAARVGVSVKAVEKHVSRALRACAEGAEL